MPTPSLAIIRCTSWHKGGIALVPALLTFRLKIGFPPDHHLLIFFFIFLSHCEKREVCVQVLTLLFGNFVISAKTGLLELIQGDLLEVQSGGVLFFKMGIVITS